MAKKRVNGEGTIGKRKDGRWEARYIAGRDPETGKQIRKSILGKTQAEVRTKLKEALAEATEIDVVKSGEYNVAGWVQAWYSLYAQPNVRETTARYYKGYIDHHVLPRLGDIPLSSSRVASAILSWSSPTTSVAASRLKPPRQTAFRSRTHRTTWTAPLSEHMNKPLAWQKCHVRGFLFCAALAARYAVFISAH